ncbi:MULTISPECIES: four-carbon acid sugar kinase family protein [Thalassospira]|uniref:four-carbon acid sugar kinase family protein n=1 Tax=Thalassospira TaxID=168934 RepID=UPI000C0A76E6|nr:MULTISPECIES: four-carbon acid sugar kinase family protein [Thalassospira]MAC33254.1 hypothetical protein [Haliea sp.]HBS21703.1 hypothetical protein [Thalassospira sp.]
MSIVIIADDLTGALDSVVCFVNRGMTACVAVSPEVFDQALARKCDVVAVCTSSRNVSDEQARKQMSLVLDCLPEKPSVCLKKIDSRLKGNISEELRVIGEHWQSTDLFVCPAIPAQGRVVRQGELVGTGVDAPIKIARIIQGTEDIPDVDTVSDILKELPDDLGSKLFVGAAGLAEALAHRLSSEEVSDQIKSLPKPALLAIGSRDPITRVQVDSIRSECAMFAAPNGELKMIPDVAFDKASVIEMVECAETVPVAVAGERFSAAVAQCLETGKIATLLACGGETAASILNKVGIGVLSVMGEVLPGMPVSKAIVNGQEVHVVTKSGGFGNKDALSHILSRLD